MSRVLGRTSCSFLVVTSALAMMVLCAPRALAAPPASTAPLSGQTSSEFSPIDTRVISDPLFLPRAGQLYGTSVFTWSRPTGTNVKNGVETGTFSASDGLFDQAFAYGITNRLAIRVGLGYADRTRDSTSAVTGDVTVGDANGFSDPAIGATYRVLDQSRSPLTFDVGASYSPDTFVSKASGGGLTGTVGRGGQNAGVALVLGREMRGFTIAGTVSTTHVGQQTTDVLSNGTSTLADPHWSYDAGLSTQTRFSDRTSLNAGVTYGTAGTYGVANVDRGNAHTYNPPATVGVNVAFNVHLVPNRVVAGLTYGYDIDTEAKNVFATATSDTSVKDRRTQVIGARLLYTFN